MTVSVSPATFTLVLYDAAEIQRVAEDLAARLGIAADIELVVDERTPVTKVAINDVGPIRVEAGSGALEDPRRPRHFSASSTETSLARVLLRRRDRDDGSFADAPGDAELSLAQRAAWDVYCMGRYGRLGFTVHEPRWRYNFRNRHGFSDAADEGFDRLWKSDRLTWGELEELSHAASAAVEA